MADINFSCAKCGQQLAVDDVGTGTQVNCPHCGSRVLVPASQSDATSEIAGQTNKCPSCGTAIHSDFVLCTTCGLDFRTGKKWQAAGGDTATESVPTVAPTASRDEGDDVQESPGERRTKLRLKQPYQAPPMPTSAIATEASPIAVWNPTVAFYLSILLFTPVFGSALFRANYKVLGNESAAKRSLVWIYIGIVFLLLNLASPFFIDLFSPIVCGVGLLLFCVGYLVAWYRMEFRPQAELLCQPKWKFWKCKKELEDQYTSRKWGKPIGLGLCGWVAYIILTFICQPSPTNPTTSRDATHTAGNTAKSVIAVAASTAPSTPASAAASQRTAQANNTPVNQLDPKQVKMQERLKRIVIPTANFREAAPIDIVTYLSELSRKLDPKGEGVNIVLQATSGSPVTLWLRQIPLADVLKYSADLSGLQVRLDAEAVVLFSLGKDNLKIRNDIDCTPNPTQINAMQDRLTRIIFPELDFREVELTDAVIFLSEQSRKLDPKGEGVNIVLQAQKAKPVTVILQNLPLYDALKYIAALGNFKFRIDANAVVFEDLDSSKPQDQVSNAPNPTEINASLQNTGQNQAILQKLSEIKFPEINFREASLVDVVTYFSELSRKLDPKGEGVNIVLGPGVSGGTGESSITIQLHNIPMLDALKLIVPMAGLKYRIDSYAVVLLPTDAPDAGPKATRVK